jgi:hypothetical protein
MSVGYFNAKESVNFKRILPAVVAGLPLLELFLNIFLLTEVDAVFAIRARVAALVFLHAKHEHSQRDALSAPLRDHLPFSVNQESMVHLMHRNNKKLATIE